MEGEKKSGRKKSLVINRWLMLIVLLGAIAIIASPWTQGIIPRRANFRFDEYQQDFILNEEEPTRYFGWYTSGEKTVIKELTTNGSPVVVQLLAYEFASTSEAILQNVTHIQQVYIVGTRSNWTLLPVFSVTWQDNRSATVHVKYGMWMFPFTDIFIFGPSGIELLAIPLLYASWKNWGHKPDRHGYALLLMIILSAALITPLYVFIYNNESALVKNIEIQSLHAHNFMLNSSHPLEEFSETIESADPDIFVRVANLTTNGVPVSVSFTLGGIGEIYELHNVTTFPLSRLQFEIPTESVTSLTVRIGRITQNATVGLFMETIRDVWTPRSDIRPFYVSATLGLAIFVLTLGFPQRPDSI